jgi:hypothetical protein
MKQKKGFKREEEDEEEDNEEQESIKEHAPEGTTFSLHKDNRETVVEINKLIYKLVPTGQHYKDLLKIKDFKLVPHVRRLNPVQQRSEEEQREFNEKNKAIHNLYFSGIEITTTGSRDNRDRPTSTKKAISMGADVPKEIEKLLLEKAKAQKEGDEKRSREIRRRLRALDYKRYIQK